MPLLLAPTFKTRKAFTLSALFRYHQIKLPNCNDLPMVKGKALQLAAVSQVARLLIRILRNDEMWRTIIKHPNLLYIPITALCPQLPRSNYSYEKRPTRLRQIWGKHTSKIVKLLTKLPRHRVVFGLSPEDEHGDVELLRDLAEHPAMHRHTFLLHRPLAAPYYTAKVEPPKKRRRKYKVKVVSATAVMQIDYKQRLLYQRGSKKVCNIKAARKSGSFIILD